MKKEEYKLHGECEKDNWWFVAKRKNIKYLLRKFSKKKKEVILLDIGCGSGANSEIFEEYYLTIGLDISTDALSYCRDKKYNYLVCANGANLPIIDSSIDIVVVSDVLEHLDDNKALRNISRICKAGSLLIITVPALSFLWTSRDICLGHIRRYSVNALKIKLLENQFKIKKLTYANIFLFPFLLSKAIVERYLKFIRLDKEKGTVITVPRFLNQLLIGLLSLESILWRRVFLFCGTSILCVAEKTNELSHKKAE